MRNLILIICIGWLIIPGQAQTREIIPSQQLGGPQLIVNSDTTGQPLILSKYTADITINGNIAETQITLTFFNPHNRVLEGEFSFPLPEGSFVNGYALNIGNMMVDGVVVEKKKGRIVFESVVRKGIDPGLVEWEEGNNFKTRIFPIPAKGSRIIRINYLSEVLCDPKTKKSVYYLPLQCDTEIRQFSLRIKALQVEEKPVITQGGPDNLHFSAWEKGYQADTEINNFKPSGDIKIQLPRTQQKDVRVEQDSEGDYYFAIHHQNVEDKKIEAINPIEPRKITILWDASGSRKNDNHQQEIQLLSDYLSKLQMKEGSVELVLFHYKQEKAHYFTLNKNSIQKLVRTLEGIQYDGATSMSALLPQKNEKRPDLYLLFSDGRGNWDNWNLQELTSIKAPVVAFSGSNRANHALLRYIAGQTGGMYLNLQSENNESIIKKIGTAPCSFISTTVDSGTVTEIYPQAAEPVKGTFALAGKLESPQATITMNFGINNRIMHRETIRLTREKSTKGNRIRTYWAQKKINALQMCPGARQQMVETGKKYGLVTPGTSLIVLDNLNQYLEYRIEPPKTLPQMREMYLQRIKQQEETNREEKEKKLKNLIEKWNQRVEWWNTEYPLKYVNPEKQAVQPGINPVESPVDSNPVTSFSRIQQHSSRYITGKVYLEDGSVIPGALVTLINKESNKNKKTVTNERGDYIFFDISKGNYQLKVELDGFNTVKIEDIELESHSKLRIDALLTFGNIKEKIVVDGRAVAVNDKNWNLDGATISDPSNIASAPAYLNNNHYQYSDVTPRKTNVGVNLTNLSELTQAAAYSNNKSYELNTKTPGISITEWNPKMPYLEALDKAGIQKAYDIYYEQRDIYQKAPSFYLDCADYFFKKGKTGIGIQILSNLAEMDTENPALLRVLGQRLEQLQLLKEAAVIFEKVLEMRPEEPQSYRDLALVLSQMEKYHRAVDLLIQLINGNWDNRFEDIELIALMEVNNILAKAKRAGIRFKDLDKKLDKRLQRLLEVGIRIVLTWDADLTDMDLWVIEPNGEKCFYGKYLSTTGGRMSNDFTQGYGPEEYIIKKALKGEYKIQVNYFGSRAFKLLGAITLQVDIFTDYGKKTEKKKSITLRLNQRKNIIDVGRIQI